MPKFAATDCKEEGGRDAFQPCQLRARDFGSEGTPNFYCFNPQGSSIHGSKMTYLIEHIVKNIIQMKPNKEQLIRSNKEHCMYWSKIKRIGQK